MEPNYLIKICLYMACCAVVVCVERNINCTEYSEDVDNETSTLLVHVLASGELDDIHYFWSTYQIPSILIVRTAKNVSVAIDTDKLKKLESGVIYFDEKPLTATGFSLSEVFQNFYQHNTDDIKDAASTQSLDILSFNWKKPFNSSLQCSNTFASLDLISFNEEKECFSINGTFEIQFSASASDESSNFYPHLIYTGNSTQAQFFFKNMFSNSSRTRYGLEIMRFHEDSEVCLEKTCKAVYTDSISDEFSPGVFSDVDLKPPCIGKEGETTFMRWRPVAYISSDPNVANSSDAHLAESCIEIDSYQMRSIAEIYFKSYPNVSASFFNITFGTQGDGFYQKTGYTSWSFMMGTGSPSSNKLSVTAIVLVGIGLGTLIIFFITGALFLSVQHCRKKEDPLLLNENPT